MSLDRKPHHKNFGARKSSLSCGTKGLSRAKASLRREGNYGSTLKRSFAKRLGSAKPKEGSRRALKRECKSITAQLVKMRDGHQCQQCLEDGVRSDCVIDAGHVYPVSAFHGGEFDLTNIYGQCRRHNLIHIGRPELYLKWFENKFGYEALEALHERALASPPTNDELRKMIQERAAQVEELRLLAVA